MRLRSFLVSSLLLLCMLVACNSNDESQEVTEEVRLLFGDYVGLVPDSNYSDIYLMENSMLYLDTLSNYPSNGFYEGAYVQLDEADYQLASELIAIFPSELFEENENYVGCPDCADQGGYYVEYQSTTKHAFWNIDKNKEAIPEYLHEFVDKISEKLTLLSN